MTAPRQLLVGATYLVTRRCSERRLFLRPSAEVNAIFRYVLAVAAERYQIEVHAFCVLSNHFHLVVTDPHARLPDFHRCLDSLVARATNRALGRWESFWDPASYSAVRLEDPEAILEKMVYVLANPVAAGLVRRGTEWPGLWSDPSALDGPPQLVERPEGFFRKAGALPATAQLRVVRPPGFEADEDLAGRLLRLLRVEEDWAAARLAGQGRSFLSAARVLALKPTARPATVEPRRRLRPRIASRNPETRLQALRRLKAFARRYQEAFEAWTAGAHDAVFPPGTWLMRVRHAATCEAAG